MLNYFLPKLKICHETSEAIIKSKIGIKTVCQKIYEEMPMVSHRIISAEHFVFVSIGRFSL
jgi:hypothetical protein